MSQNLTAFIFARGGSKGVPGKNIRALHGKPLIAYAIEAALGSKHIKRVVVSTDNVQIADAARKHGAQVPFMRPVALASDDSSEWLAWQHAIGETGIDDIFVSVPATCPLRKSEDVDHTIDALMNDPAADIAITVAASHSNPYFTMVTQDTNGYVNIAARPEHPIVRRQDAPKVMDIVGVAYAARVPFVLKAKGLWDGKVRAVEVPRERAIDIDTEFDFHLAELLMKHPL